MTSAGAASVGGSDASGGGAAPGGDSEPAAEMGMTAAHNAARAAVVPAASPAIPPLVWSSTVAASAQAWADQCNFKHSGNPYGENIYAGAGQDATPQQVVDSWVSEAKSYDYAANTCSGTCGHYTQVVWRKSTKLGCGVTNCTKNSPFSGFSNWQFWVCEYDPPGNFNGEKPY
jgi:pathogenesis-related protein 1